MVALDTGALVKQCWAQGEKAVKLPTFYAEDTPASANEVWQRIHSDPLFAVGFCCLSLLFIKTLRLTKAQTWQSAASII